VTYHDRSEGLIVYVKASLTGHEPLDVLQYHAKRPDFPHETTADQFFDEAQWETGVGLPDERRSTPRQFADALTPGATLHSVRPAGFAGRGSSKRNVVPCASVRTSSIDRPCSAKIR